VSRLAPDDPNYERIIAAHDAAIRATSPGGGDGYADPVTGLFVFTAAYHWRRGSCCENDCRHCPYVERA
jgi:hypothetical protein